MTIRKMTLEDIPRVMNIENACFSGEAWSPDSFEFSILNQGYAALVADSGDDIAGYTVVSLFGEANIDSLAVKSEYRRQGVAKALIKAALSGFTGDVFLEVRQSNLPARELYRKLGFEQIYVRKNYYINPAEDAIVMSCRYSDMEEK